MSVPQANSSTTSLLPGARYRMQLAQALDHADGFLDRLADQLFDFRRRGTVYSVRTVSVG